MHEILLVVHNLVRWVVIVAGLLAFARAVRGSLATTHWSLSDGRTAAIYRGALQLQGVLGIFLYIVSPLTRNAILHLGPTMRDAATRRIAIEHPLMMLVAIVVASAGGVWASKARTDRLRFQRTALVFGLSLLLIAFAIPWSRPLVRALS